MRTLAVYSRFNISAANSINQGNSWTGAINQGLSMYGLAAGAGAFSGGGGSVAASNPTAMTNWWVG